jgi:hypothetical protein
MDGRPFVTTGGNHKALAFPGSEKKHALLGEHLLSASLDPVFVTEGGPDFLAACWLAYAATTIVGAPSWKPVGFLGSNCDFTEEQVSKLSNRLVRIFVHADKAGHEAAEKWKGRLKDAGCRVQLAYVERICEEMPTGKPVEDLNDALIANEKSLEQFTGEVIAL